MYAEVESLRQSTKRSMSYVKRIREEFDQKYNSKKSSPISQNSPPNNKLRSSFYNRFRSPDAERPGYHKLYASEIDRQFSNRNSNELHQMTRDNSPRVQK